MSQDFMRELRVQRADLSNQLIVAEYEQCRAALLKNVELMDRSENFYLGGAAAAAVLVFNSTTNANYPCLQHPADILLVCAPLIILIIGLLRFVVLDRTVKIYNNYIEQIEDKNHKIIKFTKTFRHHNKNLLYYGRITPFLLLIVLYMSYVKSYIFNNHNILISCCFFYF
jgi:hypothetical protein